MPSFKLNKLVRDKLVDDYIKCNQQAEYKKLSSAEHKSELIRKIIEEVGEIKSDNSSDEIISEIADIKQAIDDYAELCDISSEQIESKKQLKFNKKGGFSGGNYVTTIKLADGDEWVDYYRKSPDIFPEIK